MKHYENKELEAVIGLEIHVQLKTKSKMFCSCNNKGETMPPNTTVCPVCMGHPGTLPVPNREAITNAVLAALSLHCTISERTEFDRKSYFYPDLPKGYQISQFRFPIGREGWVEIAANSTVHIARRVRIERLHLEEDAAKLVHPETGGTFVDFNRAGTPLMEIVSHPDMRSPLEAKTFLQELQLIMRTLDISDADLEKGHMRADVNISLRPKEDDSLHPKTEIKNVNSFRAVERAIAFEIKRQTELWREGKPPHALETRGWDESKQKTVSQRTKEEAHDYRYFPEPDIPPIFILRHPERSEGSTLRDSSLAARDQNDSNYASFRSLDLDAIHARLPELPQAKRARFGAEYGFDGAESKSLTDDPALSQWVEQVMSEMRAWLISLEGLEGDEEERWQAHKQKLSKKVASWIINRMLKLMLEKGTSIKTLKITPENFAELITYIHENRVNSTVAQEVLSEMVSSGKDPSQILRDRELGQVNDPEPLRRAITATLEQNPQAVADFKAGKENVLQFLVGQIMKSMRGRGNPSLIREMLKVELKQ